ncbi:magnesium and cobalt transport protein CorA [Gulosibacter sediminis]|uniref:magnesium and cobalt transport protein CorA n=1 Tax=Gulosibacter sediminis TaxID=1729695 RepID=UPI0024A8670F|nr:magnesium and cobalt transport protein CorA [Gulosibacter sediminis]
MTHGPIIRLISGGQPSKAPAGTTPADALDFVSDAPDRMAMSFYPEPTPEQIAELGTAWQLHPVMLEDILIANQRPKLERAGDVLLLVLRSARYLDDIEEIDFDEFHVLVRPGNVAVLCQDNEWIDGTRVSDHDAEHPFSLIRRDDDSVLAQTNLLALGPEAVVYRVIDAIVDGYEPVLRGLEIDQEQIERQVFSGDAAVTERIYRLSQEVIDMLQTVSSMTEVVTALRGGFGKYDIPAELQKYLDDVTDHLARHVAQTRELKESLTQILSVNSTLVAQRQNEDMKKISGWAAILFAPTLVGAIYGMNFDHMPELHWAFGYPMALGMMLAVGVGLYFFFKRANWM